MHSTEESLFFYTHHATDDETNNIFRYLNVLQRVHTHGILGIKLFCCCLFVCLLDPIIIVVINGDGDVLYVDKLLEIYYDCRICLGNSYPSSTPRVGCESKTLPSYRHHSHDGSSQTSHHPHHHTPLN